MIKSLLAFLPHTPVSQRRRLYDLPLNRGAGAAFSSLLIGLMSFLCTLLLCGILALFALSDRWEESLQTTLTIEIPAADNVTEDSLTALTRKLRDLEGISHVHVYSHEELAALIAPWIDLDGTMAEDLPMPRLIGLETQTRPDQDALNIIREEVKSAFPEARIDSHDNWLDSILSALKAVRFILIVSLALMCLTLIITIVGGTQARIAIHSDDIQLLHMMGARDRYITAQFQRHAFLLSLMGALIGTLTGLLAMIVLSLLIKHSLQEIELPAISIQWQAVSLMAIIPLTAGIMAALSARATVLYALHKMP